ncbi:MAG TPA: cytochrome c biogenesis protein CcsA [Pseudomonadales bacterium]|nr:cytochrome c biogenesis protein CcsA [Pseudomonadales bacterium]
MNDLLPGLAALVIYIALAIWQWRSWSAAQAEPRHTAFLGLAALALCLHGLSVYSRIDTADGFNFGFFRVASLIFWVINITVVISSLKLPVRSLLPPLFVMTSISITCSLFLDSPYTLHHFGYPIAVHILLSLLAYSVLTIAAMQAIALAVQDRLLKARQLQKAVAYLPPLQTMESLLFEMVWAGTVLLALSIASGVLFIDNILAQHLAHKMFFSLAALGVYGVLLWGRYQHGWRGKKAIRWVIGGFIALMLAYFGTKLVLEFLLR